MSPTAALAYCLDLDAAHARLRLKLDDVLGTHHGISLGDLMILRALSSAPRSIQSLEEVAGVRASMVLRQLLALEKCGFVERAAGQAGGRVVGLRPAGKALLSEALETATHICARALPASEASQPADARLAALCGNPALALR